MHAMAVMGDGDGIQVQVILLWQWLRLVCVLAVCWMLWQADAGLPMLLEIEAHRTIATLWGLISVLMLGLSLGTGLFQRHPDMHAVLLLTDVMFLGALGTLHGGLLSGVFLAYMPLVMAAGMALPMLWALLVAAISVLAILGGCIWLAAHGHLHSTVPYGIFGALLLLAAVGFSWLNKMRLRAHRGLERKTQAVFDLQQLNDLIIRNVRTGIMVLDDHLRIITTNASARKLLALSAADLQNSSLDKIPALHEPFEEWRCNGTTQFEPIENSDGSCRLSLEFVAMPEALSLGGIVFLQDFGVIQRRVRKIKSQYLMDMGASIAHEMRNPLAAISQAGEALQQDNLGGEAGKMVRIISRNSMRLGQIITNTLQAWRDNSGPGAAIGTLQLRPWIEDFAAEISHSNSTGRRARIEIDWRAAAAEVRFDPGHLRQVLTNICDNGLRYSLRECGEPRLCLRISESPQSGYMLLDVIDYGPGIGDGERAGLFTAARSRQGCGLGLHIARELCEVNLASLAYKRSRTKGEGSVFQIAFGGVQ